MTPWERKLWNCFLKKYPVRFQRQKCIGNYIVDYYCFKAKLVVELDGGGHYDQKSEEKDRKRTEVLEKYGLRVLRFCNLDVDKNFYCGSGEIDFHTLGSVIPFYNDEGRNIASYTILHERRNSSGFDVERRRVLYNRYDMEKSIGNAKKRYGKVRSLRLNR